MAMALWWLVSMLRILDIIKLTKLIRKYVGGGVLLKYQVLLFSLKYLFSRLIEYFQ